MTTISKRMLGITIGVDWNGRRCRYLKKNANASSPTTPDTSIVTVMTK